MDENNCEALPASKMIGKKWTMLILEELSFHQPMGFNELQEKLKKISSKVLSEQLQELEGIELIHKEKIPAKPVDLSRYTLTEKGKSLHFIFNQFKEWNSKYGNHNPNCRDTECATCNSFIHYVTIK